MQVTRNEINAALDITIAIGKAIAEAGPAGIPSGTIYGTVAGKLSLSAYQGAVQLLKNSGCVRQSGDMLVFSRELA